MSRQSVGVVYEKQVFMHVIEPSKPSSVRTTKKKVIQGPVKKNVVWRDETWLRDLSSDSLI